MGKSRAKKHRSSRASAPRKNPSRSTRGAGGAAAALALETTEAPASVLPAPEASHEPMVSEIRVCAHLSQDSESAPLEHTPPATSSIRLRVDRDDAGTDSVPPSGPAEAEITPAPAPVVALFDTRTDDPDASDLEEPVAPADADDLSDAFFAKGGVAVGSNESAAPNDAWFFAGAFNDAGAFDDDEPDSARARKTSPVAAARRAQLSRYVAWVVGGASLLCAVAAVREAFRPADVSAPPPVVAKAADGSLRASPVRAEPVRAGEVVGSSPRAPAVEAPAVVLEPVVERASQGVSEPSVGSTNAPSAER